MVRWVNNMINNSGAAETTYPFGKITCGNVCETLPPFKLLNCIPVASSQPTPGTKKSNKTFTSISNVMVILNYSKPLMGQYLWFCHTSP